MTAKAARRVGICKGIRNDSGITDDATSTGLPHDAHDTCKLLTASPSAVAGIGRHDLKLIYDWRKDKNND